MNKYIHLIMGIGVPEKGARLYLSLLEYGESNIAELAEKTNSHRMEVYRQLPLLLEIGLVSEIKKGKRKQYLANDPRMIQDIYEEQKQENETHIKKLREEYRYLGKKPKVFYKQGKKGVSFVFADIINSLSAGEVFYRVSSEKDVHLANTYLPKDYRSKRDKKQLERYVIMSESGAKNKTSRLERELVSIPKAFDEFEDNISLTVYANKIAYIDFSTETSIIIEQKELASFQKKLFILLFKSLRK